MKLKNPILIGALIISAVVITVLVLQFRPADNHLNEAVATSTEIDSHEGNDQGDNAHATEATDMNDWCAEHQVPESVCTLCNPSLIESFKASGDWCGGHDIPESHCRLCNPEIRFPQESALYNHEVDENDWCAGHSVPESQCTLCHPKLIELFKAKGDWCAGHGIPESHCRLCNPGIQFPQELVLANREIGFDIKPDEIEVSLFFKKNSPVCATNDALIQFASSETVNRAGLSVHKSRSATLASTIEAPAETVFDESRFTVVTTSVPALVTRWLVSPGDVVAKNDVLAILNSPEIANIQATLISANAEYAVQKNELDRHEEMKARNLISATDFDSQKAMTQKALADLTAAKGLLAASGLTDADISQIIENGEVSNQLMLRATESGTVVERVAKLGERLNAGSAYAMLADPSAMWIEARVPEDRLRKISVGQKLTFTSDGRGLNQVGANIIWVSKFLDPHSRTGTVRASIIDPSHRLQAGEFGRVKISESDNSEVILVPKDAVQWEGCCNVVFVKETDSRYRPRKVDMVESSGPYYQITGGLTPGEEVVVEGAFLLKTELKKSSIGAGCCDFELAG